MIETPETINLGCEEKVDEGATLKEIYSQHSHTPSPEFPDANCLAGLGEMSLRFPRKRVPAIKEIRTAELRQQPQDMATKRFQVQFKIHLNHQLIY
jgi:hypothetical protein